MARTATALVGRMQSTVAKVLTEHELLADGSCRCGGWNPPLELWHAEHVAGLVVAAVVADPWMSPGTSLRGLEPF